ncbi:ABC transporter permease [Legionella brunensis]|uniref:ABC transporter permease n=1 Tax=Legionella brunensis TaxID=29422 RepID=A0A0W0SLJ9_9GAMM|nr:ABC transporter permease [Legionella brunensis]KTC84105.1 ABC transporter permease [Legionella brunensis]
MSNISHATLRLFAIQKKEFIAMMRDANTYFFLILIPLVQVILFGYIINTDAKNLPTIVVSKDSSQFTNSIIQSFKNSGYFDIKTITSDENEAEKLMDIGKIKFILYIPENFSRDLISNKKPHLLLEGEATDPMVVGNAFHATQRIVDDALRHDAIGPIQYLASKGPAFIIDRHAKYNPAAKAQYHTLPGLLVSVITISLTMLTAISLTTEYETGTMEMLLITPIHPLEVIFGKIIPNIVLGYILFFLILLISRWLFHVPFYGSFLLLTIVAFPFFMANLGIGILTSSISKSQFQAANIANTYALPALLLSGFMFPFAAMPQWAQLIGHLFPSTYFLRITSDIMLKDANIVTIWPNLWPLLLFTFVVIMVSHHFYRQTLD